MSFSMKGIEVEVVIKIAVLICVAALWLVGCGGSAEITFPDLKPDAQAAAMEKWQRSCALCHVDGNGGAPRMGDREAWSERLKQSSAELLQHMVQGKGRMPPLGYCMDCTGEELLFLTQVMAGAGNVGSSDNNEASP